MTKVESYLKRNKVDVVSGWTYDDYLIILNCILNDDISCVNDILIFLNNKTLDDLVKLLENNLKIGNKKLRFRTKCKFCKKDVYKKLYLYYSGNFYCDMVCRNKQKKYYPIVGKEHHSYTSKSFKCTNCGIEMDVPPYKFHNKNRFGDNHVFCSQKCCWEYRGKYYTNNKCNLSTISKERRSELSSINALNNLRNNKYPSSFSGIHRKINELLDSVGIPYKNESVYGHFSFDIELLNCGLLIEIMGNYWHANPLVYKDYSKLNKTQLKDVRIDKAKRAFIKKYENKTVLNLWEDDINNNIDKCAILINSFIINSGLLNNYESFNYNNDGILNNTLIHPHLD